MRIDTTAIDAMEPVGELAKLHLPFRGTALESLSPVIAKLHTAWAQEPERILAFFLRDNREVLTSAKHLLGLDVLDWAERMKQEAIADDSMAKMVVLLLAGYSVSDTPGEAFKTALEEKRYGMALWAVIAHAPQVVQSVGDDWTTYYLAAANAGNGYPYSIAQTLNGAMAREAPLKWQAGLKVIAKAKNAEDAVEYFASEGQVFASDKFAAFNGIMEPIWAGYALEEPEGVGAFDAYHIVADGYVSLVKSIESGIPDELKDQMIDIARNAAQGCDRFLLAAQILATQQIKKPIEDVIADLTEMGIGR